MGAASCGQAMLGCEVQVLPFSCIRRSLASNKSPARNGWACTSCAGLSSTGDSSSLGYKLIACAICAPVALPRDCQIRSGARALQRRRRAKTRMGCVADQSSYLASLPPVLMQAAKEEVAPDARVVLLGPKEQPGGVPGIVVEPGEVIQGSLDTQRAVLLRSLQPDLVDAVIEMNPSDLREGSTETGFARYFYPYGGHESSLARDLLLNLASVAKVLRPGGHFIFMSRGTHESVLFGDFLKTKNLDWAVRAKPVFDQFGTPATLFVCTLRKDAAEALQATMSVLAEEVEAETSRRRYFDVLRRYLPASLPEHVNHQVLDESAKGERTRRLLDVGGGDGSLAAFFACEDAASPWQVTLMESNPELAERAQRRFQELGAAAEVVSCGSSPWPFQDDSFDVVVLAFVLHHVAPHGGGEALPALLREARRVISKAGGRILVLEDLPEAATGQERKDLAWLLQADHFRPFGQLPDDYLPSTLADGEWCKLFARCGLQLDDSMQISGTLRHPVPHKLYSLVSDEH